MLSQSITFRQNPESRRETLNNTPIPLKEQREPLDFLEIDDTQILQFQALDDNEQDLCENYSAISDNNYFSFGAPSQHNKKKLDLSTPRIWQDDDATERQDSDNSGLSPLKLLAPENRFLISVSSNSNIQTLEDQSPYQIDQKTINQYQKLSALKSSYCSYIIMGSPKDNNVYLQYNMSQAKKREEIAFSPVKLKNISDGHKKSVNQSEISSIEASQLVRPYRYDQNKAQTMNTEVDDIQNTYGGNGNDSYGKSYNNYRQRFYNDSSQQSNLIDQNPNPEITTSSVILNTMSQGPILLDLKQGQQRGLIIIDPYKGIKKSLQRHPSLTMESVKSNEEMDEQGVSSVKTSSKLRPDFSSYNSSPNKADQTQVQRFSSFYERQSTMMAKYNKCQRGTDERSKLSQNFRVNSFQRPFNTTFITQNDLSTGVQTTVQRVSRSPLKYGNHRADTLAGYVQDKYLQKNQKILEVYEDILSELLSPQSKLKLEKKVSDIMNDSS
ncbi:UNKNOWN [Stylonychia lemnae]|uniref:Uncharacterized protein n=1 Tax=Stylonychia lemnae TaxID=5949 RepID=A0A077ZTY4_STYLE|nr:UNKNOWN [Stylonychia lemnae]|eukprot:CDW71911.1 UNKNOWN [Stylonychia lemnae]